MTKAHYDLYVNSPGLGIIHAADCVVVEQSGLLTDFGLRYRDDYLHHQSAFSLDPKQFILGDGTFELNCSGGMPGIVDDYLPDAWGRKVLAQLALYRDQKAYNANSVIDGLALIGHSRIGGICIVKQGEPPFFDPGAEITHLEKVETAAQQVDAQDFEALSIDEMSLLYLANNGTGVGGARPKALVHDEGNCYIAKFNRLTQDPFNNARIEHACLTMARKAGITVPSSRIHTGINGREVLLVERFDINDDLTRNHLISINALLKESHTQRDYGQSFRYDNIYQILQHYSDRIEHDLKQLLKLMLFNRMINNTDDHERNFSLLHEGGGFHLAPAYDMIPSTQRGGYHAAGFQYTPLPPRPSETTQLGRVFGLSKSVVAQSVEEVLSAGEQWPDIAHAAGVKEEEIYSIHSLFHF